MVLPSITARRYEEKATGRRSVFGGVVVCDAVDDENRVCWFVRGSERGAVFEAYVVFPFSLTVCCIARGRLKTTWGTVAGVEPGE